MPNDHARHAARLSTDVPEAESRIDDALIALSTLMGSVVTARRDTRGADPARGQAAIRRVARAQESLIAASSDVLRVHGELAAIGREVAGYDLHECPKVTGTAPGRLKAVE